MSFAPRSVTLRKLCEAPEARFSAAGWSGFIPGQRNRPDESLPIGYELTGDLLAPPTVGEPLRLQRTSRNGVVADGEFLSSAVQEIGTGWVRTENSLYLIRPA